MTETLPLSDILKTKHALTLSGVPEGYDAMILADIARGASTGIGTLPLIHIATDDQAMETLADGLKFFGPDIEVLTFPAWDCLPYDRTSPKAHIISERMATLCRLSQLRDIQKPTIILTTANAALQKVPTRDSLKDTYFKAEVGVDLDEGAMISFLTKNGYIRTGQVMEPGEFAQRGGLIDIFPPGCENPYRLDLFGEDVESIKTFNAIDQRTFDKVSSLELLPISEFIMSDDAIKRFRREYQAAFGAVLDDDPLYLAVTEGRRMQGVEHWLPLFHEEMATLFDYLEGAILLLDHKVPEAVSARVDTIHDYYDARMDARKTGTSYSAPYKPLPPSSLYLDKDEWDDITGKLAPRIFTPFEEPASPRVMSMGGKIGRDFGPERSQRDRNIYDALKEHITFKQKQGKQVYFASYSEGARERLQGVLEDYGITPTKIIDAWSDANKLTKKTIGLILVTFEHGFETQDLAIITETDVLGDRLIRRAKKTKRAANFISEATSLQPGDLVVHMTHGVGRFEGLETLQVLNAPHDCLKLTYRGGDRLFLPVENIEMLTRFGAEASDASLDKLGGTGWQVRHAKLKERLKEMAGELIKLAAERALKTSDIISPPTGLYDEFCARFPYSETDDQLRAINDVISDLGKGKPMDRLVCGDVGFGKTEVALRSAFVSVMGGHQVAVVVPTTLLCRQHVKTFKERFNGLPIKIRQLSRLVSQKDANATREGMASGQIDIVIGTHALLSKHVKFKSLGLLIVDEEQHFGVAHKEQLKKLKTDVHVLTLTATPIPRTLQLALSGMRDLSLIATPPLDRLAIRTFVLPFDELVVREALLREHYRGGQSFYVCPRVADLKEAAEYLKEYAPELKYIIAHGQMTPTQIEDAMNAFYDGKYDVLLATTIIESGLDIPRVNTMIIHRADMFGLAQLYQLRGRVGRSKIRAYTYLTVPPKRILTETATKRLQVLQSLDTLGAGFSIASHDMDIRGAGNLLGDEQSGHIKEVGLELYQQMLEEAVAEAKHGGIAQDNHWSPQINLGATVLIPERYVPDLNLRMSLYRRIGDIGTRADIDALAAEMIDRFGPLPEEVDHLLAVINVKAYCRRAGVEKIEAGQKGAIISFRKDRFSNPAGLIEFISSQGKVCKLRPDHKLVYLAKWDTVISRLKGTQILARGLAKIAQS